MSINTDYSGLTSSSLYQQVTKKQKLSLESLIDKDKDKVISEEELNAFAEDYSKRTGATLDVSSLMSQYDTDGDGSLNESEQEAMYSAKALQKLLEANGGGVPHIKMMPPPEDSLSIDADSNGLWSSDEVSSFADLFNTATGNSVDAASLLSQYDLDEDGSLNEDEQFEMIKALMPPPQGMPPMRTDEVEQTDETENTVSTTAAITDTKSEKEKAMEDLLKMIDEVLSKKAEERKLFDNADSEKQAFMSLIIKSLQNYESTMFSVDKTATTTDYLV